MPDNSKKFNPNLEIPIPKWINEQYFEKILYKLFPNFSRINKFTLIPATPPGNNCTSIMLRVLMDIEMKDGFTEQKSYVMKTMLDDEEAGTLVNSFNIFPKEKQMYVQLIPQFEQLYSTLGKNIKFAPNCHWHEDENGRISLVLEDLIQKKFQNINRLKGFDFAHMKRILEKLAEFHAVTVIWREKNGTYPAEFQNSYLPANYQKSKSYQARVECYKAAMAQWGLEEYEKYAACIPNGDQFVNAAMSCYCINEPNEFKVLNHGDFWSSNIMLSYTQNGDINQMRFVDYQLCKWGSPAQDLWELIICSAANNIRIKEFDHFISIYHTQLLKCLQLFGYAKTLPTLRELHISMLRYGFWGYLTTFTHLVLILLPTDKESSLFSLMQLGEDGDKFRLKAFTNPIYVRAVLEIFPFLYRRGILDFK